jgi:DNA-binding IclR family transcriptional regulator
VTTSATGDMANMMCGAAQQLCLQQADDPVRQAINDQHEDGAQHDAEIVRKRGDQHFEQQHERHSAEQRTEQSAGAAEQRHDDDLEGEHRIERNRRVDIGPSAAPSPLR